MIEFTIGGLLKVDVGIAKAPASDHVSANTNAQDRPSSAELFEKHGFGHIWCEVADVE